MVTSKLHLALVAVGLCFGTACQFSYPGYSTSTPASAHFAQFTKVAKVTKFDTRSSAPPPTSPGSEGESPRSMLPPPDGYPPMSYQHSMPGAEKPYRDHNSEYGSDSKSHQSYNPYPNPPTYYPPAPHYPDDHPGPPGQPDSPYPPSSPNSPHPPGTPPEQGGGVPYVRSGAAAGEACDHSAVAAVSGGALCLGLKYVVYNSPSGVPVETDRDAVENVRSINQLWRECGIQFQIDRYQAITPDEEQLRYRTANYGELNEIRSRFMDDQTLLVVMTGTWDRSGSLGTSYANAWTNMPGEQFFGSILERPVSHDSNVLAHELGHYLSLEHVIDPSALMSPVIYRNSTGLTPKECESARWATRYFWKKMIREPLTRPTQPAQPSHSSQPPQPGTAPQAQGD